MKKLTSTLLGFALAIMAIPSANASRGEAIAVGRQVIADVERDSAFCARDTFRIDHIELGQTLTYNTFLYKNAHYILAIGGDSKARDLDAVLYDENGNLIDKDLRYNQSGLVEVTPRWSGTFYLKVKLANGARKGAWIYIIHFYQC
ncbi:MAG TPA: hypothetical protein P5330_02230 [Candidatus Competibacteraceae bacterium]|nr:hypothetical protein [Candidatus Competibacteraceae bacterium]